MFIRAAFWSLFIANGMKIYFQAVGSRPMAALMLAIPTGLLAASLVFDSRAQRLGGKLKWGQLRILLSLAVALLLLSWNVAVVRGEIGTILPMHHLYVTVMLVALTARYGYLMVRAGKEKEVSKDLIIALGLYAVINFTAKFVLRIQCPMETLYYLTDLDVNLSFLSFRVYMPFAPSGRIFGIECVVLILAIIYRLRSGGVSLYSVLGGAFYAPLLALAALGVVFADGRGPLGLLAVAGGIMLFPRQMRRFSTPMFLVGLAYPLIFYGLLLANEKFLFLNTDILTLHGRTYIWRIIMSEFAQCNRLEHFVGYGGFGQVTSGLSYYYATNFRTFYADTDYVNAHNSFLQVLLDQGFIGMSIFAAYLIALHRRLLSLAGPHEESGRASYGLWVILLFLVGAAGTEVALTSYMPSLLAILLMITFYTLALYRRSEGSRMRAVQARQDARADRSRWQSLRCNPWQAPRVRAEADREGY